MDTTTAEAVAAAAREDELAGLEALARSARTGESGAFDLLARRLGRRMMAFAVRALGDRSLAEDAVQEAMVRMYRFLPKYRDGNVLAWALTITSRTCADVRKRERTRRARLPLAEVDTAVVEHPHDPTHAVEVREALERALADLSEHLRITFLLRQQGLAYDDIASILHVPIGTVRSRLFEARRALRAHLAPVFDREGNR